MPLAVTPDGRRYLSMGRGNREPLPYHLRFGLPFLCRSFFLAWIAVTWTSLLVCTALVAVLAVQRGLTEQQAIVAAFLWLGLPSTRFLCRAPVLVDGTGTAFALGAAVLWPVHPPAAIGVVILGACVWEKAPVFAALFGWNPLLLVGLVVPLLRRVLVPTVSANQKDRELAVLESRIATGLHARASVWRDADSMLWPWGACLAALLVPDLWWFAALAVACSQLLIAYDTVRLVQNAAPAVCIAAATAIPEAWALPVLVLHWMNPRMGNGV